MKKLILALVLSCGTNVFADHAVPFSAEIQTAPTPAGPCGMTCLTLSITGTGHGSHFGRLEMEGPSEIDFATGEQTGTATITAADGSTMGISFKGTFFLPDPTRPDTATFSGDWTAVSGTRRFNGVSGGGTYHGSAAGPAGVLNLDGTLNQR